MLKDTPIILKARPQKPSQQEALEAVKTLIRWAGDNPEREGLKDTPLRVIKAYQEFFQGYTQDPKIELSKTFAEVKGYHEMVMLHRIPFSSHCEHHMVPFIGHAHIAYYPDKKVVGISKLARVVDIFAHRLQTQEVMTIQIANAIDKALSSLGVAVVIDAVHQCMTTRGVKKDGVSTLTSHMTGIFRENKDLRREFMNLIQQS